MGLTILMITSLLVNSLKMESDHVQFNISGDVFAQNYIFLEGKTTVVDLTWSAYDMLDLQTETLP